MKDLHLGFRDIYLNEVFVAVPAKIIQSSLKVFLRVTNDAKVIRILDIGHLNSVQFSTIMEEGRS